VHLKVRINPFASAKPRTPAEWQECVDESIEVLRLQLAYKWRLVDHKGRPNVERCEKLIDEAKQRFGITPRNAGGRKGR